MSGIDPQALHRTLQPLLTWSYTDDREGIGHVFLLHRAALPTVALLFAERPERFPVAALQEAVYAFDPDAVGIVAETSLRETGPGADAGPRRVLLADVLTRAHIAGQAVQDQHAFAVEPAAAVEDPPTLGQRVPTGGASDSLMPLAAVPRTDLSEVPDPEAQLVVPDTARAAAPTDAEGRRRLVLEVAALRGLATRPRPLPQVALLGSRPQVELYTANGLDPAIATIPVAGE